MAGIDAFDFERESINISCKCISLHIGWLCFLFPTQDQTDGQKQVHFVHRH
jgi:hypothetical protein